MGDDGRGRDTGARTSAISVPALIGQFLGQSLGWVLSDRGAWLRSSESGER